MLLEARFINCQSMRDLTMHFATDKLNVIAADNSVGKSVLFKMLKVTANPRTLSTIEERKQLIRYGEQYAGFICAFDNGSIGATLVYPNKVIYKYRDSSAAGFTSYAEPPSEFIRQLGLLVDEKTGYIANLIDTDQDLLFVNNNLGSNHSLIKMIAESPTLTEVQDKLMNLDSQFSQMMVTVNQRVIDLQIQLDQYSYSDVDRLEDDLNGAEIMLDVLPGMDKCCKCIETIEKAEDVKGLDSLIEACSVLGKVTVALDQIDYNYSEESQVICNFAPGVIQALSVLQGVYVDSNDYEVLSESVGVIESIMQLLGKVKHVKTIPSELINFVTMADQVKEVFDVLLRTTEVVHETDLQICSLEEQIQSLGDVLECPVHGKVVYDGKKCVPYS